MKRKTLYAAAWILFGLSLLASRGYPIRDAVDSAQQLTRGGVTTYDFVSIVLFILGCFTNLIFAATPIIRKSTRPSRAWRILVIGSLLNNAALGVCFRGGYLRQPAYWLWLLAFAAAIWALLLLPPDPVVAAPKTRSAGKRAVIGDETVPVLLWAWIGFLFFWVGVMIVSHVHPPKPIAVSAMPKPLKRLTSYVDDLAHVMPPADAARIDATLASFEKETSNQIAVVVFPEAPADDIEDFTIHAAETWKVGRQGRDNGAILFLFLKQRIARLEVGYGLEGALPDAVARQILDQQLAASIAQGNVADGIDHTLAAMMDRVRSEYTAGRTPGIIRTTLARLRSIVTVAAPQAWPFIRDTTADQRLGISFFGSLIGFGLADALANAGRICANLARLATNAIRRRPLSYGMLPVQLDSVIDTVKLIAILAVPVAGVVVLIAGGGAFGGAGASAHWSASIH
ncbi:MAG TPA: TPM domain-containing protein [Thermoanaerobaculia bacterium]|jgi:uncharacterized membrane protein YgcG|nr:TPM domain-containing protein [Thermoanaerobaculia bacterium]